MPKKPKRPCAFSGCPNLCDGQYCEEHRVQERRKYDQYQRSPLVNKRYGRAWRRVRDKYKYEHPYCEQCYIFGIIVPVEEVHHIVPVSQGGAHDPSKLLSLCLSCHNKVHHEMGER